MLTLNEFIDYRNCFNDETDYGEPQHWVYLNSGRSIEITHEEYGLPKNEQMFSIRYHCSEEEYDNGDFKSTNGVIDTFGYIRPDLALQCVYNIMQAYDEEEKEENTFKITKEIILTQWHFDHACQCLIDNGIDPDEADIVAEALFAIICDVDADVFMKED